MCQNLTSMNINSPYLYLNHICVIKSLLLMNISGSEWGGPQIYNCEGNTVDKSQISIPVGFYLTISLFSFT